MDWGWRGVFLEGRIILAFLSLVSVVETDVCYPRREMSGRAHSKSVTARLWFLTLARLAVQTVSLATREVTSCARAA